MPDPSKGGQSVCSYLQVSSCPASWLKAHVPGLVRTAVDAMLLIVARSNAHTSLGQC